MLWAGQPSYESVVKAFQSSLINVSLNSLKLKSVTGKVIRNRHQEILKTDIEQLSLFRVIMQPVDSRGQVAPFLTHPLDESRIIKFLLKLR